MEDRQTRQHHQSHGNDRANSQHRSEPTDECSRSKACSATVDNGHLENNDARDNSKKSLADKVEVNDGITEVETVKAPLDAASFPHLSNDTPGSPKPATSQAQSDGEDEEPATAQSFPRSTSPASTAQRNRGAVYQKVGEEGVCKMHRFSLYETATRYFLVGGDNVDKKFRILKIDRTAESGDLGIAEDDIVYTRKEMSQLLNTIDEGNKISGGLKLKCSTWGLLGFIRFTGAYYMLLITKRSQVAVIGGHYVYQIDGTELVSLTPPSSSRFKVDKDAEEGRFVGILNNLDLSRSFYFSYSYDITRSLQHNILREREALQQGHADTPLEHQNSMFVWNHHLLNPASSALKNTYDWCLPVVHGFVDQASKQFLCVANRFTNQAGSSLRVRADCSYHHYRKKITILCRCAFSEARSKRLGIAPLP